MSAGGRRVVVVGATGVLGSQVLEMLEERRFPVGDLLPIATDRSLGEEIEHGDRVHPVETEVSSLRGWDLAFLCCPAGAALDWVREALRAEVPCVDATGALAGSPEVPLLGADLAPAAEALAQPAIAVPPGPTLGLALALAPLRERAGLARVVGTTFESASGAGRQGIESLQAEVVALFNQSEVPEPTVFPHPVAFDCVPQHEPAGAESDAAAGIGRDLRRLLGDEELSLTLTRVQVPTFAGHGTSLLVETRNPLPPAEAAALLDKAPGIELWPDPGIGPSTREGTGSDAALVGRLRAGTHDRELLLWIASDPLRLAASNVVRLAEARFEAR